MKSTKIAFVVDGQSFQKICLEDREMGNENPGSRLGQLWGPCGMGVQGTSALLLFFCSSFLQKSNQPWESACSPSGSSQQPITRLEGGK